MSVNRELPHVMVLPEDDANRQLALGFHLQVDWRCKRQMQVLRVAGGWREVLDRFRVEHRVCDIKVERVRDEHAPCAQVLDSASENPQLFRHFRAYTYFFCP